MPPQKYHSITRTGNLCRNEQDAKREENLKELLKKIINVSSKVSLRRKFALCLVGRLRNASRFARHVAVSPRHTNSG